MSNERRKRHPTGTPDRNRPNLNRRRGLQNRRNFNKLLLWSTLLGTPAIAAAAYGVRYIYNRQFRNDEGGEALPEGRIEVSGGELVSENKLIELLKKSIERSQPVYPPDPTIIRSTLYNSMRFYGTEDETAKRRSENVYFTTQNDAMCAVGTLCVYDGSKGLSAEIRNDALDTTLSIEKQWISLISYLSHEGFHLSPRRVIDEPSFENYGFMGGYEIERGNFGFNRKEFHNGTGFDLVNQLFSPENDIILSISVPEEFTAEMAKMHYLDRLLAQGLDSFPLAKPYSRGTGFLIFHQGLINAMDTEGVSGNPSWQSFWGGALDTNRIFDFHRENNRWGFLHGLGKQILTHNPHQTPLSDDDTAGLGILALSNFANYPIDEYQTFDRLITTPLTHTNLNRYANYTNALLTP